MSRENMIKKCNTRRITIFYDTCNIIDNNEKSSYILFLLSFPNVHRYLFYMSSQHSALFNVSHRIIYAGMDRTFIISLVFFFLLSVKLNKSMYPRSTLFYYYNTTIQYKTLPIYYIDSIN